MIFRIVQYIQPWEIDELERQVNKHIESSYYIKNNSVIFDITMNVSDKLIDWNYSKISKNYFIDKFNYLKMKLSYYFSVNFDTNEMIQGAIDKKRDTCDKEQDFIIWLDSDVYFSHLTLPYMIDAASKIKDDYFILTPQIIKYWDDSWDCIVNEKFLKESHNHRDNFDLFSLDYEFNDIEVSVFRNDHIKMGAGWFNLIKSSLLKKIKFPEEMGSYGPDDTYLIHTAKKYNTSQYILKNIVVTESGNKFLKYQNYIKPLLSIKIREKQKISDLELNTLIQKFYNQ